VRNFGGSYTKIVLIGATFDEAFKASKAYCDQQNSVFIHPYENIIEGQATIACEFMEQYNNKDPIDYVFVPVGGGGICAGIASYMT